jgi:8-oxo-dGTP pyrophosphatase MutT (NUDIX family)
LIEEIQLGGQPRNAAKPRPRQGGRGRRTKAAAPDILYHACDAGLVAKAEAAGTLELGNGRHLYMSRSESQAWQVAHRRGPDPAVLYIDVSRAQRNGVRFQRNNRGLWQARAVPVANILNLQKGFGHQLSAGGFPVFFGTDGPEVALIKVRRRFGTTWEIAKGKLEIGEDPIETARREIGEEMGAELGLTLRHDLGFVRFGFLTPEKEPRLKTMFVYVFEAAVRAEHFEPAEGESVVEVAWFTPEQAVRLVTHRSLCPVVRRLKTLLEG